MTGVPVFPKLPSSDYIPGLGDQHVMGVAGVGINIIIATLACNTAQTAAELVAIDAANYSTNLGAVGPIIHSLGKVPTWVQIHNLTDGDPNTGFAQRVTFQYLTADNSAVYVYGKSDTTDLLGTAVRVACWP